MKAITIHQPYALLIACGAKRYETRPWKTNYRGKIAIHASIQPWHLTLWQGKPAHQAALAKAFGGWIDKERGVAQGFSGDFLHMPFGAIVAVADLAEVYRIGETDGAVYMTKANFSELAQIARGCDIPVERDELSLGDFTVGRYAWELANVRKLNTPVPCRGQQGLWDVPPDIETKINTQTGDIQCVR